MSKSFQATSFWFHAKIEPAQNSTIHHGYELNGPISQKKTHETYNEKLPEVEDPAHLRRAAGWGLLH